MIELYRDQNNYDKSIKFLEDNKNSLTYKSYLYEKIILKNTIRHSEELFKEILSLSNEVISLGLEPFEQIIVYCILASNVIDDSKEYKLYRRAIDNLLKSNEKSLAIGILSNVIKIDILNNDYHNARRLINENKDSIGNSYLRIMNDVLDLIEDPSVDRLRLFTIDIIKNDIKNFPFDIILHLISEIIELNQYNEALQIIEHIYKKRLTKDQKIYMLMMKTCLEINNENLDKAILTYKEFSKYIKGLSEYDKLNEFVISRLTELTIYNRNYHKAIAMLLEVADPTNSRRIHFMLGELYIRNSDIINSRLHFLKSYEVDQNYCRKNLRKLIDDSRLSYEKKSEQTHQEDFTVTEEKQFKISNDEKELISIDEEIKLTETDNYTQENYTTQIESYIEEQKKLSETKKDQRIEFKFSSKEKKINNLKQSFANSTDRTYIVKFGSRGEIISRLDVKAKSIAELPKEFITIAKRALEKS